MNQTVSSMTEEQANQLIAQIVEQFGQDHVLCMVYKATVKAEWSVLGGK